MFILNLQNRIRVVSKPEKRNLNGYYTFGVTNITHLDFCFFLISQYLSLALNSSASVIAQLKGLPGALELKNSWARTELEVTQARFCYDADSVEYIYREGKANRASNWNK